MAWCQQTAQRFPSDQVHRHGGHRCRKEQRVDISKDMIQPPLTVYMRHNTIHLQCVNRDKIQPPHTVYMCHNTALFICTTIRSTYRQAIATWLTRCCQECNNGLSTVLTNFKQWDSNWLVNSLWNNTMRQQLTCKLFVEILSTTRRRDFVKSVAFWSGVEIISQPCHQTKLTISVVHSVAIHTSRNRQLHWNVDKNMPCIT